MQTKKVIYNPRHNILVDQGSMGNYDSAFPDHVAKELKQMAEF